ncbi:MAG: hypothetical protein KDA22_07935 [Phycisphaerales bacterium]|nr:hypothetical protein [Phycisphaerales bacterium]
MQSGPDEADALRASGSGVGPRLWQTITVATDPVPFVLRGFDMSHTEVMEESGDLAAPEPEDAPVATPTTAHEQTPPSGLPPGLPDAPTLDDVLAEAGALIGAAEYLESCAAVDGAAGATVGPEAARTMAEEARAISDDIDRAIGAASDGPFDPTASVGGPTAARHLHDLLEDSLEDQVEDPSTDPTDLDPTEAVDRAIEQTLRADPDEELLGTFEPIESVLAQAFDQEALSREFQSVDEAEREERGELVVEESGEPSGEPFVETDLADPVADPVADAADPVPPLAEANTTTDDDDTAAILEASLATDTDPLPEAAEQATEAPSSDADPELESATESVPEPEPAPANEPECSTDAGDEPAGAAAPSATAVPTVSDAEEPAETALAGASSPARAPTHWVHRLADVASLPMRRVPSHIRPLVDIAVLSLVLWAPLVWWMALQPPAAPLTAENEPPAAAAGSATTHGDGKASSASHGGKEKSGANKKAGTDKKSGAAKKSDGHGGGH